RSHALHILLPRAYYPAADDYRLDRRPNDQKEWPSYVATKDKLATVDIDMRAGATRGFAYCFTRNLDPNDEAWVSALKKSIVGRVDGREIVSQRRPESPAFMQTLIFERDEYVLRFFVIYLESTRGDV